MLGRMNAGMWESAMWMTGYEKFFCDMLLNPSLVHAIMERFLQVKMEYWGRALEEGGEDVLVCSLADDLGTQTSLLVSLDSYRELIWPYHKRLITFIRSKAKCDVHIFFHCDGACSEAIPLLIEAGVDVLNPVQVNCVGMDTKKLKKEFVASSQLLLEETRVKLSAEEYDALSEYYSFAEECGIELFFDDDCTVLVTAMPSVVSCSPEEIVCAVAQRLINYSADTIKAAT